MTKITKEITVNIKLAPDEIAELIWNMDHHEQACLLAWLADIYERDISGALYQMQWIKDELKGTEAKNEVSSFIDRLQEYLGVQTFIGEKNNIQIK